MPHKMKTLALCLALAACNDMQTSAQAAGLQTNQGTKDLSRRAADYAAFIDAENAKSATCKAYIGKVVIPTSFDALAQRQSASSPKGEFETSAQYEARQVDTAKASSSPTILISPIDRNYVRYNADVGAFLVLAGTFKTGSFSDETSAEVAADVTMFKGGNRDKRPTLEMGIAQTTRTLGTELGRNIVGGSIRVTNIERHTKGVVLDTERLFAFASDKDSTVTGFEYPRAEAPRLKPLLRAAVALEVTSPLIAIGSIEGEAATAQNPVHYVERSTILTTRPICGLILDAHGKVLASADAGSK